MHDGVKKTSPTLALRLAVNKVEPDTGRSCANSFSVFDIKRVASVTSGSSLSQVHGGLQAVLSVQQVRKMMEDGGELQHVLTAADVPQLQPRLL